jgi:L-threonylcarbamoyladenylate synthase
MITIKVSASQPDAIPRAHRYLQRGKLVAFPTDTVYGLAADAFNRQAIRDLFRVKGREADKAIAVLVGNLLSLDRVVDEENFSFDMKRIVNCLTERFWPGPLTVVVPRHPDLPDLLSPLPTIGVRMPDHPIALALLNSTGPLAVTSANRSGKPSTISAEEVLSQLKGLISLLLDGGRTSGGVPSTVVDCTQPELRILRIGPISEDNIQKAILKIN